MILPWMKALHLVADILWVASLMALPWLFAVHARTQEPSTLAALAAVERRLHTLMNLASGVAIATGAWMLWAYGWTQFGHQGWLHAKLTAALLLIACQGWCSIAYRSLRLGGAPPRTGHLTLLGFAPLALMAAIVVLVVVRPF
jgi:putative membrane protein